MNSERFGYLSTAELEALLEKDFRAENHPPLSIEDILCICKILSQRRPVKIDVHSAWNCFLEFFYPEDRE